MSFLDPENQPQPHGYGLPVSPNSAEIEQSYPPAAEAFERMVPNPSRLSVGGILAWAVVIFLTFGLVVLVATQQAETDSQIGRDASSADLLPVQMQSKLLVGQQNLDKIIPIPPEQKPKVPLPAELDAGCYEQRLIYAALKSEFESPDSAITYLAVLDERVAEVQKQEADENLPAERRFQLTDNQQEMRQTIDELLESYIDDDYEAANVPEQAKSLLRQRLGFPAELLLLPEGTTAAAERTSLLRSMAVKAIALVTFGIIVMGAGTIGLGLAIGFPIMIRQRKLTAYFFNSPTNHNIYIQTFAIWMLVFFGSSIVLQQFELTPRAGMMLQPLVFFGSLGCLLYPLLRGVTLRQLRFDIGWTIDRPLGDVLYSVVSYLATLPCLIPGFVVLILYMTIASQFQDVHEFGRLSGPEHPIQQFIASGDFTLLVVVFFTACVAAPVVEETMFRGVLYRHIRDLSQRWARWLSILFSALLNGFIFAAIHPQGIATIPVLMSLAICFSLVREWRNSLLSPMLMHAMHNTIVTCVSLLLL